MAYKSYGITTLHEYLGDHIVYRNLVPADDRLPGAREVLRAMGIPDAALPRKAEPAYGQVVAEMIRRARMLDRPDVVIQRLLYIGDTQMNDGTAYRNICAAGPWPGWSFIGRDALDQEPKTTVEGGLYVANRWSALPAFLAFVQEQGFSLDEGTAVVIDIDKTAIGPRGRNDQVINQARVEGVRRTVAALLGEDFDQETFQRAYDELNETRYHAFTADNQDYLAYICLILGAGFFDLEDVVRDVQAGTLAYFCDFIACVQARRSELAGTGLLSIHDDVWALVQRGDPTPFKAFRYNEYLTTVARFGDLPGASIEQVLAERITIAQEVRQAALDLRARGALVFGVSDKPDEASIPSAEQAARGMLPLHRLPTLAVGEV